jgi:ribonuclease P protein component
VTRSGRRSGSDTLVVHLLRRETVEPSGPVRIGFVVGGSVGNAVLRHRVQRRLRHLCRERLSVVPLGCDLVVRALAPSASATYSALAADLDRCLRRTVEGVS